MAEIKAVTSEKVFSLSRFLGLNQNPDGDTKLKMGEAAEMYNFRITRDGNLQRRPGTKTVADTETGKPIKGLWCGFIKSQEGETDGVEVLLGASDGKLYIFWADTDGEDEDEHSWREFRPRIIVDINDVPAEINTDGDVHIFGFGGMAYILDGEHYYYFNGPDDWGVVDGYVPLVYINVPPVNSDDQSSTMENVNRLTLSRRVRISPDGTGTTFQLPEKNLSSIDYVKDLATGENVDTGWTGSTTNGTVTFSTAPAQAVDSYEIGYTAGDDNGEMRGQVERMRYAELYAGTQDTRVFLYGDGTNKCIYSGIDYNGTPRADYFPDLYECLVGDSNTPITGMIRHYNRLICFKSSSSWSINATDLMTADALKIPAFYVNPVNRTIGNAAMGQVQLLLNSPYTLFGDDLYEWKNRAAYGSNLTSDERQAVRVSDRIWATLKTFKTSDCYCYDDNDNQEYYICYNNEALVFNYASDGWARYTDFPVSCMANVHGELYIGDFNGKLKHLSYDYPADDFGEETQRAINAYWESGSMSFGQDYMRKYAAMLWVGLKPESPSEVWVTVQTDRDANHNEKVVGVDMFSFANMDFEEWDFNVNSRPAMRRLKIKAKKFVFYKLIFKSNSDSANATVLAADIRVRFTGYTK